MAHVRLIPSDAITSNRITSFSLRGYVYNTPQNVLVLGFHIDRAKSILFYGAGPGLGQFLGYNGLLQSPTVVVSMLRGRSFIRILA